MCCTTHRHVASLHEVGGALLKAAVPVPRKAGVAVAAAELGLIAAEAAEVGVAAGPDAGEGGRGPAADSVDVQAVRRGRGARAGGAAADLLDLVSAVRDGRGNRAGRGDHRALLEREREVRDKVFAVTD